MAVVNASLTTPLESSKLAELPPRHYEHIRRSALKNALRLFQCKTPFAEMRNILHSPASIPELTQLVTELKAISVDSAEGNVLAGGLQHIDELVVVKYHKPQYDPRSTLHEYLVGIRLNELRELAPNFIYTYKFVICSAMSYPKKGRELSLCNRGSDQAGHVLIEYIKGVTLESIVSSLTMVELGKILLAVFSALEIANHRQGFCHYDLHAENILLRIEAKPITLQYRLSNGTEVLVNTKYVPVIIDYGFARSQVGDVLYSRPDPIALVKEESEDFVKGNHPYLDWHKLFAHLLILMYDEGSLTDEKTAFFHQWLDSLANKLDDVDRAELGIHIDSSVAAIAQRFYYPLHKEREPFTYLDALQGLLQFQDIRKLSVQVCPSESQIIAQIYGSPSSKKIPCNGDYDLDVDIRGSLVPIFKCAAKYSDGMFPVLTFPKGTKLYAGNLKQIIANAELPLQDDNYYKAEQYTPLPASLQQKVRDTVPTFQERKELRKLLHQVHPPGVSVFTSLIDAQNANTVGTEYQCGEYCVTAYQTIKYLTVVDLAGSALLFLLKSEKTPLVVKLVLLITHQWNITFEKEPSPEEISDMLHVIESPHDPDYPALVTLIKKSSTEWIKKLENNGTPVEEDIERNVGSRVFVKYNYLTKHIIPYLEKLGYAGFAYQTATGEGHLFLGNLGNYSLKRDYNSPYDWQFISDQYLFGSIGKLVRDLRKYKTTDINGQAGDLWAHSVWVCLYLQWMFQTQHPAVVGIYHLKDVMIAAGFLHDIGKGGDLVYLSYEKTFTADKGFRYLERGSYLTQEGAIDLNEVLFDMGIAPSAMPLLKFLIRYQDFFSVYFETIDLSVADMLSPVYNDFMDIVSDVFPENRDAQQTAFNCLYALWSADIMAAQPFISLDKLKKLSTTLSNPNASKLPNYTINEYVENFPFLSNVSKSHHGMDVYRDWRVEDVDGNGRYIHQGKGLLLRDKISRSILAGEIVVD